MNKFLLFVALGIFPALPPKHVLAAPPKPASTAAPIRDTLAQDIRKHMTFLAGDAMNGRGSATKDELRACEYVAGQLKKYGIQPAGDMDASGKKTYLQRVAIPEQRFRDMPSVSFTENGKTTKWAHGKEVLISWLSAPLTEGELQPLSGDALPRRDAVVLTHIDAFDMPKFNQAANSLLRQGARVVLVEETPMLRALWKTEQNEPPVLRSAPTSRSGQSMPRGVVIVSSEAARALRQLPTGTSLRIGGAAETVNRYTHNVVGALPGTDTSSQQSVLFSAHIDHLGVQAAPAGGSTDTIYNGADDDASGVVAVMELARALSQGKPPKRTVYFACFGSEETGGAGASAFLAHPPTPLENIVCNLEFEMIGRPDPKIAADALWLTGFERSNLGPELQKQGARLVADPHPDQNFFYRSDNIQLARRGVIAQTVSSFGLHPQYHHPDDDLAHIDFDHMSRAIASLLKPAQYLVNSDFVPTWVEGQRP